MIEKITDPKDVTFVVQGGVHPEWTPRCIASIKKFFPSSEVILATNTSEGYSHGANQLIIVGDAGESKNNLRRQISTSKAGLGLVRTKFAVKVRSDLEFTHNKLFDSYNTYLPSVSSTSGGFKQPVGILNIFTYAPTVLPLFLSDFIAIGLTGDIQHIFNCPLPTADMNDIVAENNPSALAGTAIGPEQYLAWFAVGTKFKHAKGFADGEKKKSVEILKNSYIVLDMTDQAGIMWHKHLTVDQWARGDCLSNAAWRNL